MKLPVKLAAYPPPEFQWYGPGSCPHYLQASLTLGEEGSIFPGWACALSLPGPPLKTLRSKCIT